MWSYIANEFGGGAWTIQRADGTSDRIDINDIRVSGGIEWTGPRGLTGFVEAGFVFNDWLDEHGIPYEFFNWYSPDEG